MFAVMASTFFNRWSSKIIPKLGLIHGCRSTSNVGSYQRQTPFGNPRHILLFPWRRIASTAYHRLGASSYRILAYPWAVQQCSSKTLVYQSCPAYITQSQFPKGSFVECPTVYLFLGITFVTISDVETPTMLSMGIDPFNLVFAVIATAIVFGRTTQCYPELFFIHDQYHPIPNVSR